MVSLDSPVLTLGGLFIAGNQAMRANSGDLSAGISGGESGRGLLAGGFGASSAEYSAQKLRDVAGLQEDALSDELAQALVGAGVGKIGRMQNSPMLNAAARGIHYNAAAQAFQEVGLTLGQVAGGNGGSNGSSGAPSTQGTVHRNHNRNMNGSSGEVF
jgi:hypothetical protein